jgi:periplasmic divalent cation tolerance protein
LYSTFAETQHQNDASARESLAPEAFMQPHTVVIVLTTWSAGGDPGPFATALVESGLAACVNVLPDMESIYQWKGKVERERERQVLIKTTASRVDALRQRFGELHPYDVPEMLVLPVEDGGAKYLEWVRESVGSRSPEP